MKFVPVTVTLRVAGSKSMPVMSGAKFAVGGAAGNVNESFAKSSSEDANDNLYEPASV